MDSVHFGFFYELHLVFAVLDERAFVVLAELKDLVIGGDFSVHARECCSNSFHNVFGLWSIVQPLSNDYSSEDCCESSQSLLLFSRLIDDC